MGSTLAARLAGTHPASRPPDGSLSANRAGRAKSLPGKAEVELCSNGGLSTPAYPLPVCASALVWHGWRLQRTLLGVPDNQFPGRQSPGVRTRVILSAHVLPLRIRPRRRNLPEGQAVRPGPGRVVHPASLLDILDLKMRGTAMCPSLFRRL